VFVFLELFDDFVEFGGEGVHVFQVVFGQGVELLNIKENIDQFVQSSDEVFEFLEDLGFRESELLTFGHISYFFFGVVVTLFVFSVQFDALV
jgi:hypothetical protein